MLDQVFQDRLEIANAVNSASVWSRDEKNASAAAPEFGYGKILNKIQQRTRLIDAVEALIKDRKSTRLNSSHSGESRMPSSA